MSGPTLIQKKPGELKVQGYKVCCFDILNSGLKGPEETPFATALQQRLGTASVDGILSIASEVASPHTTVLVLTAAPLHVAVLRHEATWRLSGMSPVF